MTKTERIERSFAIDLLRVIVIFYVVGFWHLFDYTSAFPLYENELTTRLTYLFLGVFTLISSYLIGLNRASQKKSAFHFYKKKPTRIYPLYFLALGSFYLFGIDNTSTLGKSVFYFSCQINSLRARFGLSICSCFLLNSTSIN
jgi:peptidoglycan/LPS O-acetylase OafA/YrhL